MKNKILSVIIIIVLSTILGLAYNASTNLSLRLLEATDDVRPFREDFNYNFELVDDIFDDVSLVEFGYLDGVTSAIQTQLGLRYLKTEIDSFSELQSIISDKTLLNEEDVFTIDANWVNTANPWADNEVSDTLTVTGYMQDGDINTFSELQSWVSDKTLINEEDAIIFDETVSMVKELDITGALAHIDINPAGQTSQNIVDITPTATLNATQTWCGYNINGAALDPNGVDSEIIGFNLDFSGVDETNFPIIHGFRSNVPFGQDAFHIIEGQLHIDTVLPATAASEFTTINIVIDSSAIDSTSEHHAVDVATTGTPAGEVVALGTHTGVEVIHQHIATFATPSQTEFAGIKHTNGTVWVDGIDAYGVIFVANSDAIYVGGASKFDEIEVIMTAGGTKSVKPTFWYNTAADAWTQFFPADDTDGFQQSGEIRWEVASITATWTGDGDPGGGDTTAGYWIKIVRTRVGTVGSPDPATVKTGTVTEYKWDKTGDVTIKGIIITSATPSLKFNDTDVEIYRSSDTMYLDSYDGWVFNNTQGSRDFIMTWEGNFGIGTAAPSGTLDVNVANNADPHILLSEGNVTKWDFYNDNNDDALQIKAGTTLVMELDTSGNLDIKSGASYKIGGTSLAIADIGGLGSNVATFLATPSSANLAGAVTNETGTGVAVFNIAPTLYQNVTTSATTNTLTVAEAGLILVSDAHTETLPTASGNTGLTYHFVKTDWDYDLITLEGDGAETFNYENSTGSPNLTYLRLNTPLAEVTIVSDGSNWQVTNEAMGQIPEAYVGLNAAQNNVKDSIFSQVIFNEESYDIGNNYDMTDRFTGTATSTSANKLVDSGANFTGDLVGVRIKDDTGGGYTYITAIDNTTTLSVRDNIFAQNDDYTIVNSKFVVPVPGKYYVKFSLRWKDPIADKAYYAGIKQNAATISSLPLHAAINTGFTFITTIILSFAIDDEITSWGNPSAVGVETVDFDGDADLAMTSVTIRLISKD